MTDGKITLRLRNVAYTLEEGDDAAYESVDESRYHGVDVGILLTGEDGIAYQIYCDQMNDLDWIGVYRVTKNLEKGLLKDVTQSPLWSKLVGDEVVIDLSARKPRVVELRGSKHSLYCYASGEDRIIVQATRPDLPENIDDSPEEKRDRADEKSGPDSGVVEALKEAGAFCGASLILFVFVWPPWFLLLQDAVRSAVTGLLVSMGILLIRAFLLPHSEAIFVVLNAVIILAICFVRWLS